MDAEKDKKVYELAMLISDEEKIVRAVELVRQHNGEPVSEPRSKKLALAYKIKGSGEAVFTFFHFRAAGEDVKNLEHDLTMREEVIRFMVVNTPSQVDQPVSPSVFPSPKRSRMPAGRSVSATAGEAKPSAPRPLSNEALEKKIEEILG